MASFSWPTHAVRGLIKIWGEDKIKKILDGTKRNTLAYDAMVEGLQADYNFTTTRAQVISKTKYLKKQFATGKKYNRSGVSLDDILKVCPFWEELKPILDAGDLMTPRLTIDSGGGGSQTVTHRPDVHSNAAEATIAASRYRHSPIMSDDDFEHEDLFQRHEDTMTRCITPEGFQGHAVQQQDDDDSSQDSQDDEDDRPAGEDRSDGGLQHIDGASQSTQDDAGDDEPRRAPAAPTAAAPPKPKRRKLTKLESTMDAYMQEMSKMEKEAEKRQRQHQAQLQVELFAWEERQSSADRQYRVTEANKQRQQDREMAMMMMQTMRECMGMPPPQAQRQRPQYNAPPPPPAHPSQRYTPPPPPAQSSQYTSPSNTGLPPQPYTPHRPNSQSLPVRRTFYDMDSGSVGLGTPASLGIAPAPCFPNV